MLNSVIEIINKTGAQWWVFSTTMLVQASILITLLLLIGSLASLFIDWGYPRSRESAITTMISFNKNNETHYFNLIEFSTTAEKERGLKFKTTIKDNEGGLFIFPHEQDLHF